MTTKWESEEHWLAALYEIQAQIAEYERPGTIFFHRRVLDRAYTTGLIQRAKRRFERVMAAGDPDWRARYKGGCPTPT